MRAKLAKAKEFGIVLEDEGNAPPLRAPGSGTVDTNPKYLTQDSLNQFSQRQSNALVTLQNLNAEHFELFGKPLGGTDELLAEVNRQHLLGNKGYTLRAAWEAKNNVAAKRAEVQAANAAKHDNEIREATRREMLERHGSNPNIRSGQPSRYDKYKASDASADGKKPWQAARGHRERNENWRGVALEKVRSGQAAA
jgi:hypothetical protein